MPRLRLRRLLLTLVLFTGLALVGINFRFRDAFQSSAGSNGGAVDVDSLPGSGLNSDQDSRLVVDNASRKPGSGNHAHYPGSGGTARGLSAGLSAEDIPQIHRDFTRNRPWFMRGGKMRPPARGRRTRLYPHEDSGDRIVEQLMFSVPRHADDHREPNDKGGSEDHKVKNKKILLFFGRGGWNDLPMGRNVFIRDKCPVNTCELTTDTREASKADAIFFKDRFSWPKHRRHPEQVWILFLLECPLHTQGFGGLNDVFNWTATYRHDSDLVAPYEKWVPYDSKLKTLPLKKNYAIGKNKMVAWFVSNCAARNKRMQYARELAKYIDVDIYGSCGPKRCPRNQAHRCFDMLDKDYRFYLAFENSNCKDYITEKFYVNGLSRNVLPIVMGAQPEDYERNAPYKSYIHVEEFPSAKELADYLHVLAKNESLYNDYFRWKQTGEFINTFFWCRLCALLHAETPLRQHSYKDMHNWWAGPGTCVPDQWSNHVKENEASVNEAKR